MYKLIAVAVISLFLMVSTFLFLPKAKKIKKEKPKTVTSQKTENKTSIESDNNVKPLVKTFNKSDKPKGHKLNGKQYVPFTKEEHDKLMENLKIKVASLAKVRKERLQRFEDINENEKE